MNDEPPSILAESSELGLRKRIKDKIKEIYQNFSYKPQNKLELAGSISCLLYTSDAADE